VKANAGEGMNEPLTRSLERWRDAEVRELDDQADAAFADVFRTAVPVENVPLQFTASTMTAVQAAIERDARRARRSRLILAPIAAVVSLITIYLTGGVLVSGLSWLVVAALDLLIGAVVGIATSIPAGADMWTVVATLGRAAAALLTTPAVTVTILAIQGIAIAAFVALQRLLRSDGELLR
jgi:hypothetical protein